MGSDWELQDSDAVTISGDDDNDLEITRPLDRRGPAASGMTAPTTSAIKSQTWFNNCTRLRKGIVE